ncbi:hypothetical protein HX096_07600 [Empedobacter falsenii]|uniref:hypothetical protein n=1 Tax=Empedobacter falsenii TaxID=343874 RepID=UPI0025749F92|nr:hypothetical protein [Empedobacter falsenii]MDM1547722.1 hypothetical protein [Empedobacter falsenii]
MKFFKTLSLLLLFWLLIISYSCTTSKVQIYHACSNTNDNDVIFGENLIEFFDNNKIEKSISKDKRLIENFIEIINTKGKYIHKDPSWYKYAIIYHSDTIYTSGTINSFKYKNNVIYYKDTSNYMLEYIKTLSCK